MSSRFTAGSVSLLLWAALMFPALGWVTVAAADQGPSEKEAEPAPRHRISFGAQWFDAAEGDSVTGSLTYSWVPLKHHGFAARPDARCKIQDARCSPAVGSRLSGWVDLESCILADPRFKMKLSTTVTAVLAGIMLLAVSGVGEAQQIEPRTYANTPVGMNFLAVGYSYSSGNVFMDPALPIEDLDARLNIAFARYIRTFSLFGASAKIKGLVPWSSGHWEGFLDGEFRTRDASGFADTRLGLDVLLVGAPVLKPVEFGGYEQKSVVGLRFDLVMPSGQYDSSKLINLGSNRWAFHSEIGWSKTWGKWTLEAAGGAWLYTDNTDFFGGLTLSQDPFLVAKVNAVRSVRPGLWWAIGMGYGQGGRTYVDGVPRDTKQKNWRLTAIVVYPLSPTQGLSLTLASGRTFQAGPDFDVIALAYQIAWH